MVHAHVHGTAPPQRIPCPLVIMFTHTHTHTDKPWIHMGGGNKAPQMHSALFSSRKTDQLLPQWINNRERETLLSEEEKKGIKSKKINTRTEDKTFVQGTKHKDQIVQKVQMSIIQLEQRLIKR